LTKSNSDRAEAESHGIRHHSNPAYSTQKRIAFYLKAVVQTETACQFFIKESGCFDSSAAGWLPNIIVRSD
jgi:hypothetical protein